MIKRPKIGTIVYYHPTERELEINGTDVMPAMVLDTYLEEDGNFVDIFIFPNTVNIAAQPLHHILNGPNPGEWSWPPK